MSKIKKVLILFVVFIGFFVSGMMIFSYHEKDISIKSSNNKKYAMTGLGISLIYDKKDYKSIKGRVAHFTKSSDMIFNAKVINNRENDNEFYLFFYINYEKADFIINKEKLDTYFLKLKSGEETTIPVKFDKNLFKNKNNHLVMCVIPEKFVNKNIKDMDGFCGTSARYDFIRDDIDNNEIKPNYDTIKYTNTNREGTTLIINKDFSDMDNLKIENGVTKIKNEINSEFAIRAGGASGKPYLVILNLFDKQIPINNKSYWYFETTNNKIAYNKFPINIRNFKKGIYGMYGLIIPRPFEIINENDNPANYMIDISVEVE